MKKDVKQKNNSENKDQKQQISDETENSSCEILEKMMKDNFNKEIIAISEDKNQKMKDGNKAENNSAYTEENELKNVEMTCNTFENLQQKKEDSFKKIKKDNFYTEICQSSGVPSSFKPVRKAPLPPAEVLKSREEKKNITALDFPDIISHKGITKQLKNENNMIPSRPGDVTSSNDCRFLNTQKLPSIKKTREPIPPPLRNAARVNKKSNSDDLKKNEICQDMRKEYGDMKPPKQEKCELAIPIEVLQKKKKSNIHSKGIGGFLRRIWSHMI